MTNNYEALCNKILWYEFSLPYTDWQTNNDLSENVKKKMEELGTKYSLAILNNEYCILNQYSRGETPKSYLLIKHPPKP